MKPGIEKADTALSNRHEEAQVFAAAELMLYSRLVEAQEQLKRTQTDIG